MTARFENIVKFLKLHYCLSKRPERFWRENANPATIPDELQDLLAQWRYRPPGRFDFIIDVETFAFFNYQYILYGMEYPHWLIIAGTLLVIAGLVGLVIRSKQLAKVQDNTSRDLSPEPRSQLPPLPSRPREKRRSMLSDEEPH